MQTRTPFVGGLGQSSVSCARFSNRDRSKTSVPLGTFAPIHAIPTRVGGHPIGAGFFSFLFAAHQRRNHLQFLCSRALLRAQHHLATVGIISPSPQYTRTHTERNFPSNTHSLDRSLDQLLQVFAAREW